MRRENVKKALLFGAVPSWFYLAPMALGLHAGADPAAALQRSFFWI